MKWKKIGAGLLGGLVLAGGYATYDFYKNHKEEIDFAVKYYKDLYFGDGNKSSDLFEDYSDIDMNINRTIKNETYKNLDYLKLREYEKIDEDFPYLWDAYALGVKYKPAFIWFKPSDRVMVKKFLRNLDEADYLHKHNYTELWSFVLDRYFFLYRDWDDINKMLDAIKVNDKEKVKEILKEKFDLDDTVLFLPENESENIDLNKEDYEKRRKYLRMLWLDIENESMKCVLDYYKKHPEEWKPINDEENFFEIKGPVPKDLEDFKDNYTIEFAYYLKDGNYTVPELYEYLVTDFFRGRSKSVERVVWPGDGEEKNGKMRYMNYKFVVYRHEKNGSRNNFRVPMVFGSLGFAEKHKELDSCKDVVEKVYELGDYACDVGNLECKKRIVETFRRMYVENLDLEIDSFKKGRWESAYGLITGVSWDSFESLKDDDTDE